MGPMWYEESDSGDLTIREASGDSFKQVKSEQDGTALGLHSLEFCHSLKVLCEHMVMTNGLTLEPCVWEPGDKRRLVSMGETGE